jgi:hypothetical protein
MRSVVIRSVLMGGAAVGLLLVLESRPAADGQQALAFEIAPAPVHVLRADPTDKFTYVSAPPEVAARVAGPKAVTVSVTYNGFSAAAQTAFQSAVDLWATQLTSPVPISIVANFTPLDPDTLGSAESNLVYRNFPNAVANTFYAAALANKIAGSDLNPSQHDITANFNSSFSGWYFGTDGKTPAGQYDFKTAALHQLAHGLGFFGSMTVSAGSGSYGGQAGSTNPTIFDTFAVNASGQSLVNTSLFANPSTALATQLTSNNVFWNGSAGLAANGGTRPKLHAPGTWLPHASFNNLDETTYPAGNANSLMTAFLGSAEAIHDPGPITRGILTDMGWTVSSSTPGGPSLTLNRTSASFGAVNSGGTLTAQTSAQTFTLNQTGAGTVNWTATGNQPWLTVTPGSGTGSGSFTVAINNTGGVLPASGTVTGTVTVTAPAAGNSPQTLTITLVVYGSTASTAAPFGAWDTPAANATGIVGSLAVTGWSLDDTEVSRVRIYRGSFGSEPAGQQIFLGDAVLVAGARPDVEAGNPAVPFNYRAGWGYLLLTNMLPGAGNGTYTLFVYADDREGRTTLLGQRNVTIANSSSTKPFGAIDTPGQGATISGNAYVNFGWALTPLPKAIATDGSTITVFIDGVSQGTVTYNQFRSDIATLFPGYANTNGAIGFRTINTTQFTNGVHTISWNVFDNANVGEGIGSRYFTIQNGSSLEAGVVAGSGAISARAEALAHEELRVRRGFDDGAPFEVVQRDEEGRLVIHARELERVVLELPADARGDRPVSSRSRWIGALLVNDERRPLPIGSTLRSEEGIFAWAPGPGFLGAYDLLFERGGGGEARTLVRIFFHPQYK